MRFLRFSIVAAPLNNKDLHQKCHEDRKNRIRPDPGFGSVKVFEDVSKLPRRQQEHIVRVVSALVMQVEQSRQ